MPTTKRPPKYRFFKPRNCAAVEIDGQRYYLGHYGSLFRLAVRHWRLDRWTQALRRVGIERYLSNPHRAAV